MNGGIFLIQGKGKLVELKEEGYDSEEILQGILANYPRLLAGDQINREDPRRFILISREMSLASEESSSGRWSVDHLFLDQDAIPTLVEVKRSTDTRIRREVVGQLLEYGANAVSYWPAEQIRSKFEAQCDEAGVQPDERLREEVDVEDPEDFWEQVSINLKAGKIRMIFVADDIPTELRRIVEFLNHQMSPAEVFAVEVKQFVGENMKSLVPRVIGQPIESKGKKGEYKQKKWDDLTFFQEITDLKEEEKVARRLLEWARSEQMGISWGLGAIRGSFVPSIIYKGRKNYLFAVWTTGTVEIYFAHYRNKPPFDSKEKRLELLAKLNRIDGVDLNPEVIEKRPTIPLANFADEHSFEQFTSVYQWVIDEFVKSDI